MADTTFASTCWLYWNFVLMIVLPALMILSWALLRAVISDLIPRAWLVISSLEVFVFDARSLVRLFFVSILYHWPLIAPGSILVTHHNALIISFIIAIYELISGEPLLHAWHLGVCLGASSPCANTKLVRLIAPIINKIGYISLFISENKIDTWDIIRSCHQSSYWSEDEIYYNYIF